MSLEADKAASIDGGLNRWDVDVRVTRPHHHDVRIWAASSLFISSEWDA